MPDKDVLLQRVRARLNDDSLEFRYLWSEIEWADVAEFAVAADVTETALREAWLASELEYKRAVRLVGLAGSSDGTHL